MSSAIYSFLNSITNSITSRYDVKSQIATAGLWKIFLGLRKTTGQHVAVFIFEKKSLDNASRRERGASRADTEKVYELLKKEASNLARLRHPSILEVVEPVSESRSSIAFVTEPLMGTLAGMLKMENSYSSSDNESSYDIDELEIQKGLLQVAKGVQFLNDARVVHHNLTPESVFVNAKGDWKLGGLGFGIFMNQQGDHGAESYFDYNEYLPDACQINLDYAAPEFALDGEISPANDMFSLGCLAYAVHNKGVPLLHTFNNMRSYERKIQALGTMDFSNMPYPLQNVIQRLLARQPSARPSAIEFQSSKYFDNILVSAMKFLESFPEKTREEKGQFMKGLHKVLGQFPERVLKRKILPALLEELKNHQLLPYTIPNIFAISQQLSQREFCELVLPSLKPVFAVREPPQNMIVLLEKLDVLQQKTPREVFRDDVMPLVYAAIEAPTPVVQEKALRVVPGLAEALDYTTVKNSLFPRVQTLFAQTTILSVKVSTLICFHSMIKLVDKFTMQEKMVPMLRNIKTKEPAVMLATLAVYDEMGKHLDKEIIATEILPQLWRMSFGPLLNVDQFKKFMKTIRELTTRVEEAHTRHLQEVKSLEDQTRSTSAASSPMNSGSFPNGNDQNVSFEELVAGRGVPKADMFDSFAEPKRATGLSPMTAPVTTTSTTADPWASNTGQQSPMGGSLTPASGSSSPRWPSASSTGGGGSNSGTGGWSTLNPMSPTTTHSVKQPGSMSSIPVIPTPPSFSNTASNSMNSNAGQLNNLFSTPSLPPPTSAMNNLSLQNSTPSSGPNYAALRGLAGPPQQAQSSRPSSMELLQPISMHKTQGRTSFQGQANTGHKSNNLSAFDPLG